MPFLCQELIWVITNLLGEFYVRHLSLARSNWHSNLSFVREINFQIFRWRISNEEVSGRGATNSFVGGEGAADRIRRTRVIMRAVARWKGRQTDRQWGWVSLRRCMVAVLRWRDNDDDNFARSRRSSEMGTCECTQSVVQYFILGACSCCRRGLLQITDWEIRCYKLYAPTFLIQFAREFRWLGQNDKGDRRW